MPYEKQLTGRIAAPTLVLLLVLCGSAIALGDARAAPPDRASATRGAPELRLAAGSFRPARGEELAMPSAARVERYAPGERGDYVVQFQGPILPAWRAELESLGARIRAYLPDFAFKVRMTAEQARGAEALDAVVWVGIFQPAYKLARGIVRDGTRLYRARVVGDADPGQAEADITDSGAQVLRRQGSVVTVAADAAALDAVARLASVSWIENFVFRERHNEYGGGAIIGSNAAEAAGFDGSGQTVAVADTGLGDGSPSGAHADIPAARIGAIFDWPASSAARCFTAVNDGPRDVDSGHGSHVAGSAVSDGGSGGEGRGTAPGATLVFQAVEDWIDTFGLCAGSPDGYYLVGLPDDLGALFQQAHNAGARVHANSWGSSVNGDYTIDSATADSFVWSNPDFAITFSAGNSGTDANADGVTDSGSVGSPATAKNVIAVGATENDRSGDYACDPVLTACPAGGQNGISSYGASWPRDYPADPLASDPAAGGAEQMAAFSSRGPTRDGRIKPDLVAPGTWVLSAYSDLFQEGFDGAPNPQTGQWQDDGWGAPRSQAYKYFGGTSMSNPLVAGAAAVVRQYYQQTHAHNASAALVKATLINSADDLLDENNDGVDDNDFPIPNVHEGWGRVNLGSAVTAGLEFVDDDSGLSTGQAAVFAVDGPSAGAPFKVSLVWSDFPSTEAAARNLVNDLDLVVAAPDGTAYLGNVFAGGWSQPGGQADHTNNVENVYVAQSACGATCTWTVAVQGFNVPQGPQPFALVIDGGGASASADASHVGDLDGRVGARGGVWRAVVIVTAHDQAAGDAPLAGATVTGNWSGLASGSASCTTNGAGRCRVRIGGLAQAGSVTFTVTGIGGGALIYEPGDNHDPDGDSDGTAITLTGAP